jgi:protocatechuate 3,4-dioxygenase beta subunit
MRKRRNDEASILSRRQALAGAATLGAGLALGGSMASQAGSLAAAGAKVCLLTPEAVQGPFYFDPDLVRVDITEGKPGASLALTLQVIEAKDCAAVEGARVDIWQTDALGAYSGYEQQGDTGIISTRGKTYLRGTQFADADGGVRFGTIFPGWYPGRTPHIHFKVFLDANTLVTGQLYFPDDVSERIYETVAPYNERKAKRETLNSNDIIFQRQGGVDTLARIEQDGISYRASLIIGIDRTPRET